MADRRSRAPSPYREPPPDAHVDRCAECRTPIDAGMAWHIWPLPWEFCSEQCARGYTDGK